MLSRRSEDRSILGRTGAPPDLQHRYGEQVDQVVDVYRSVRRPRGSLLLLHGGFWDEEYDRTHLRPMAAAFRDIGVDVLLPGFRRVRGAGGWPMTFDDVQSASTALEGFTSPACLVGHSAGGQLALWLAATTPPAHLVGVVALAAVTDLVTAQRMGLGDGAVSRLLDGTPTQVPQRYADVNPAQLPSPACPVHLIHGQADSLVPSSMATDYARSHKGAVVRLIDGGHFELVDPDTEQFAMVLATVRELFD